MYVFDPYIEKPKDYDLRSLKCGGWFGSRMQCRSYGKWAQFFDPNSKEAINQDIPIDMKKKYIPPKKKKTKEQPKKTQKVWTSKPKREFSLTPKTIQELNHITDNSTRYNNPPFGDPVDVRRPKTRDREPLNTGRSSASTTMRSRAQTTRSSLSTRTKESTRSSNQKINTVTISPLQIPEAPKIVHKRHGDNPDKFPFRVSTVYLTQLSYADELSQTTIKNHPSSISPLSVIGQSKTAMARTI